MRKRIALIAPDLYTGGISRCVETLSMGLPIEEYEQTVILLKEKKVNFKINGTSKHLKNPWFIISPEDISPPTSQYTLIATNCKTNLKIIIYGKVAKLIAYFL